ncbi:endonuclease VII domain-containing protein [Mycolicibacterium conceptionense]|uniref:endonuclease VII domain-containing protein n=1 Tax=Mycolicibacterium TaxID=1866885 RepID=UPI000D6C4392
MCGECGELKPYDQFHTFNSDTRRNSRGRACKPCTRLLNVEARYSLPRGAARQLIETNGDRCGICGSSVSFEGKSLSVDHCHSTGSIRGILCGSCNSGLGYFKDNPALLQAAIKYLDRPYLLTGQRA